MRNRYNRAKAIIVIFYGVMAMHKRECFEWAVSILEDMIRAKKYGEVVFKFEAGEIKHADKRVSLKPPVSQGRASGGAKRG